MKLDQLEDISRRFLRIVNDYPHLKPKLGERFLDLAFYAMLEGRFSKMSRQYQVYVPSKRYPVRIDFRHGTSNPVLIEFAARPPRGGAHLNAPQNTAELRKLARIRNGRCVLLLIDAYHTHLTKSDLKPAYDLVTSARGKYKRHAVTILYVHRDHSFRFEWSR